MRARMRNCATAPAGSTLGWLPPIGFASARRRGNNSAPGLASMAICWWKAITKAECWKWQKDECHCRRPTKSRCQTFWHEWVMRGRFQW